MPVIFKRLFKPTGGRLSRRIAFWVFISVIVIETIILIPSYNRREKELLSHLKDIALAQIGMIMQSSPADISDKELFDKITMIQKNPSVTGGALYTLAGREVGSFGEKPETPATDIASATLVFSKNENGMRYDLVCLPVDLKRDYILTLRHDASPVQQELNAFTLRIGGLVLIISIFVTAGAWIALNPLVVTPILNLREDLNKAGEAISKDQKTPDFYSASIKRKDELGDVIATFIGMYSQISDAVEERKQVENELQQSLRQIEAYSKAQGAELNNGRQMQANFLPLILPEKKGYELAAYFKPARQVSGDFYDTFNLPGDDIGIVVADVCDKGVGAALFMALFRSLIRIFSGQTALNGLRCSFDGEIGMAGGDAADDEMTNPLHDAALRAIPLSNSYVAENHGDLAMFATIFFGVLDPATGNLSYINGGHEPPLIINASGDVREKLMPSGPAVGIYAEAVYKIEHTRLAPGDSLFAYTDGLVEASSVNNDMFGVDRMLAVLKEGSASVNVMLENITRAVNTHTGDAEQFDDITLMALHRLS